MNFLKLSLARIFSNMKRCFEKTKKVLGHHARLRDVMDQSYPIYACTRVNHARYSCQVTEILR